MNDYLLPRVVDEVASKYPDKLWMTVPISEKLDQGWRDLTFGDLGKAVNNLARWMDRTVGVSNDQEAVAYIRYERTRGTMPLESLLKRTTVRTMPVTQSSLLLPLRWVTR